MFGLHQKTLRVLAKQKGKIWKTVVSNINESSLTMRRDYSSHALNHVRNKNHKKHQEEYKIEENEIEESDDGLAIQDVQIGGMLSQWPRSKVNTFANVCPQGEQHVIERFG